jgi:hypothetical protein
MDLLRRSAAVAPATLDADARTVEVVFSTGARVVRAGLWADAYVEELSLDARFGHRDQSDRSIVITPIGGS